MIHDTEFCVGVCGGEQVVLLFVVEAYKLQPV